MGQQKHAIYTTNNNIIIVCVMCGGNDTVYLFISFIALFYFKYTSVY